MVVTVDSAELVALMNTRAIDVVDVRNPDEWDTGHVPGARLVPLDRLLADPDAVLSRALPIVFVCAKGVRSMQAAKLAERFGYGEVFSLNGGTKEWARAGLPIAIDRPLARVAA